VRSVTPIAAARSRAIGIVGAASIIAMARRTMSARSMRGRPVAARAGSGAGRQAATASRSSRPATRWASLSPGWSMSPSAIRCTRCRSRDTDPGWQVTLPLPEVDATGITADDGRAIEHQTWACRRTWMRKSAPWEMTNNASSSSRSAFTTCAAAWLRGMKSSGPA
jgi:hypothetical protein